MAVTRAVTRVMGAAGEASLSLTHHAPPAVWPGSLQAADPDWSAARGLGTPGLENLNSWLCFAKNWP